jgi:histone deacetylase 6
MTLEDIKREYAFYEHHSLYVNKSTALAARLSCGGVISACEAVVTGKVRNAIAVVRPPGHHAEPDQSMGFSFLNNVAVATKVMQRDFGVKRVLILDW